MSSSKILCAKANNTYVIASAFLLESILQWLIFEYLEYLDVSQVLLCGNSAACLVMLMAAFMVILMYRFTGCELIPIWLKMVIALILVELVIVGAGGIVTSAPVMPLLITGLLLAALFALLSFVGCYMMTMDTILFVGFLCLCTFIILIGCVLLLTFLLAIEWQVEYTKLLIMSAYPVLIFNIAYDSRTINDPDKEANYFEDNLRYGLCLYGAYMALLLATLTVVVH